MQILTKKAIVYVASNTTIVTRTFLIITQFYTPTVLGAPLGVNFVTAINDEKNYE